jgi:hypothetical protein
MLVTCLLMEPSIKFILRTFFAKDVPGNFDSKVIVLETYNKLDYFMSSFFIKSLSLNSKPLELIVMTNKFKSFNNFIFWTANFKLIPGFNIFFVLNLILESFKFSLVVANFSITTVSVVKDITLDNFQIGKEIISKLTTQRNFHKRHKLTLGFRISIFLLLFSEVLTYKLFKLFFTYSRPKIIIVNEIYWFPWSSLTRAAIHHNISCIQYVGCQEFNAVYLRKINRSNFYKHPTDVNLNDYNNFLRSVNVVNIDITNYVSNLYDRNNWFARNQKKIVEDKLSKLNIDIIKSASSKKLIVGVFPHIFWDAASIYGDDLFINYYDWFLKLLNYINSRQSSNITWVIKMHPDLVFKSTLNNRATKKLNKYLTDLQIKNNNVKIIWPADEIRTDHLLTILDYCVTVRGTVGIESSILGVKTITAGTGRYANRNFTIDSTTIDNYFEVLNSLDNTFGSTLNYINDAHSYAKVIFLALPFRFKSKVFNSEKLGLYPLDNALSLITEDDLTAFNKWYNSSAVNYGTNPFNISEVK